MNEKIKVSKEVANGIEYLKENGYDFYNSILIKGSKHFEGKLSCLNEMNVEDFCKAWLVGYELELTKEERILEIYKDHYKRIEGEKEKSIKNYHSGFVQGLYKALEELEIEIEGINK